MSYGDGREREDTQVASGDGSAVVAPRRRVAVVVAVVCGVVIPVGILGGATCILGSAGAVHARLRGDLLYIPDPRLVIANVTPGDHIQGRFTVTNVSDQSVRILGAQTTCDCVALEQSSIDIPARQTRAIPVRVHTRQSDKGSFVFGINLILDAQNDTIPLSLTVTIARSAGDDL